MTLWIGKWGRPCVFLIAFLSMRRLQSGKHMVYKPIRSFLGYGLFDCMDMGPMQAVGLTASYKKTLPWKCQYCSSMMHLLWKFSWQEIQIHISEVDYINSYPSGNSHVPSSLAVGIMSFLVPVLVGYGLTQLQGLTWLKNTWMDRQRISHFCSSFWKMYLCLHVLMFTVIIGIWWLLY